MKITIDLTTQDQGKVSQLATTLHLSESELILQLIRSGLDQQLEDTAYQAYFQDLKRSVRKNGTD